MRKKLSVLLVFLLGWFVGLMAQSAEGGENPPRVTFEMSTCRSFTIDDNGVMQEGKPLRGDYRITFEPATRRWGESVRKKGQSGFSSFVSRLQPEVKVTHCGNDIEMKLTDHQKHEIQLDGDGRIYVYDTAAKGRLYTDTEGLDVLGYIYSDGRTMAKGYILALRDMFRGLDYYQVEETRKHL